MGHRHLERMSAQRNDHEVLLAREARIQQRLEDAYVEVLTFVYRVGQWVDLTRPLIDVGMKARAAGARRASNDRDLWMTSRVG